MAVADAESSGTGSFRPPPGTVTLGLRILIVTLGVFFAAGLLAYLTARTGRLGHMVTSGSGAGRITLPAWFWFSTFVILVSSVTLYGSLQFARAGRAGRARVFFLATTALGWLFLVLQVPGLVGLVRTHRTFAEHDVLIYALVLFLVGLHGLHVIGGLVPLTVLAARSSSVPFDARRARVVRHMSAYWHFLAAVWIVMFSTFLLAR